MVLGDIFKRWHQLKGEKALLATGVVEHGMKVRARDIPDNFIHRAEKIIDTTGFRKCWKRAKTILRQWR